MALSGSLFSGLSAGVNDIFGAIGDLKEADAYGSAAKIANQNAALAQESGNVQQLQMQRKIYQTVGAQRSEVAGAGLASSGSALDLFRSSMNQGALSKQLISLQTGINVGSFEQEASAYKGMASAAKAAAGGGFLGGALQIAGAVLPFL